VENKKAASKNELNSKPYSLIKLSFNLQTIKKSPQGLLYGVNFES
jgi:hypothetical protein